MMGTWIALLHSHKWRAIEFPGGELCTDKNVDCTQGTFVFSQSSAF